MTAEDCDKLKDEIVHMDKEEFQKWYADHVDAITKESLNTVKSLLPSDTNFDHNNYYKIVANESELKWFYDHVLPVPELGESYMVCRSARNKRLTDEERKYFHLARSEMLRTEIIMPKGKSNNDKNYQITEDNWNYDIFKQKIYAYEFNKLGMLTKSGLPYPDKVMVTYIYMALCSERKCIQESIKYANQIKDELIDSYSKGSKDGIEDQLYKLAHFNQHNKSVHALSASRKPYIDFDMDITEEKYRDEVYSVMREKLNEVFGSYSAGFIVETTGGFHTLIKKEYLKFNPQKFIDAVLEACDAKWVKEFIKNDNLFIPIPGTYQYETPIIIRNKEDH